MPDSTDTTAKIEISPADLRRILAGEFREEVTKTIWSRVLSTFTFGGALSIGVIVGLVTWSANWLNSTVAEKVTTELGARVTALRAELTGTTNTAAQAAVQRDITNVEAVRGRVIAELPEILRAALGDPAIRNIIQAQANEQTAAQLRDPVWRRGIERSVLAQQAGDATQPPLVRLFAFTDLLRDSEGEAIAIRILLASALRVPSRGLGGDTEEARFLGQAVATYGGHLSRSDPSNQFSTHEPLIRRLAELVAVPPQPGNAFEALVQRFSSPVAISFLVRRARETTGEDRDTMLQALLTHPADEAKEQVESRLCAVDSLLRADLLRAAMARPGTMVGDPTGQRFFHLVRCAEDVVVARRVPRAETECLPFGDLSVLWQLARQPAAIERLRPSQRAARGTLGRLLRSTLPDCGVVSPMLDGGAAALRTPLGWSSLLMLSAEERGEAPMLGLIGLLPPGPDGSAPEWVTNLAGGRGPLMPVVENPGRYSAHVSLLLERLGALPEDTQGMAEARLRLTRALVEAPVLPGRPTERLLLDAMQIGGAPLCGALLLGFAESPSLGNHLSALGESVACVRGNRPLAPELRATLLIVIARLASMPDSVAARRALGIIAFALGLEAAAENGAPQLANWALTTPAGDGAENVSRALAALLTLEGPGLLALMFERADDDALRAFQGQLRDNPIALAPLAAAAPYLDHGFAARLAPAPAPPLATGGRVWTTFRLNEPGAMVMPTDPAPVVLQLQPLAVQPIESSAGTMETAVLSPGTYILGAVSPDTLAALRPRLRPPEIAGLASIADAPPLAFGTTFGSRIGPEGPRLYPFALEAGRSYEFVTARLQGGLDTMISLLDPGGQPVPGASNDDYAGGSLASRMCVPVAAAGVYWLAVENYGGAPPNSLGFELRAGSVPACPRR